MPAPKAALRDIHEFHLDPTKPLRISHVTGHLVDERKAVVTPIVTPPLPAPKEEEYVQNVLDASGDVIAEVDVKIETAVDGTQTEEVTVIKKPRGKKVPQAPVK